MLAAGRQDDEAIELAFSKKKIEERKAWLAGFLPGTYLDQSVDEISYSDFVNKACAHLVVLCWERLHLPPMPAHHGTSYGLLKPSQIYYSGE